MAMSANIGMARTWIASAICSKAQLKEETVRKHIKYIGGVALVGSVLMAGSSFVQAADTSIATVVKIAGIQWFNRMEEGVNQYAKDNNVNAFQVGPAQADPQQQAALIEDMIA